MRGPSRARPIGIAIVAVLGAAACVAGVRHRFFDYDEIYHAHVTWLIAQGDRPFHDFFASHSPFLWYPLATLWRILAESPAALLPLRVAGVVGNALATVSMAAAWAVAQRDLPVAWLTVGVASVAVSLDVLDYAIEFRPDGWSTALLFLSCFLFLGKRPAPVALRCATFACLAGVSVLLSPKLAVLPLLVGAIDLLARVGRGDQAAAALLGYAAGGAVALLLALSSLWVARVDPWLAFQMAAGYQLAFASQSAFGLGLLQSVVARPHLLALVGAGVVAWAVHLRTVRRAPHAYEAVVLLFLAVQLLIIDRPYKQYYAPWFLLASCFVPFIGLVVERSWKWAAPWCFGAAVLIGAAEAAGAWRSLAGDGQAQRQLTAHEALLRWAPAREPIVAYPPLHPVVRRDVFYAWNRTTDPAGRGTEEVMRTWRVPGYSERFAPEYYRHELEARPPALVLAPLNDDWGYERGQWAAVSAYLAAHRDDYVVVDRGLIGPAWLRRDLAGSGGATGGGR